MEIPSTHQWKVAFIEKEEIAQGVWSLYFTKPSSFLFLPGQYMDITLMLANQREETYSFTIASTPLENKLMITTRESTTEFKKSLFGLTKGQEVAIRGPLGLFTVGGSNTLSKVFLSGGIGITPFRSILTDMRVHNVQTPITLIASFPKKQDIIFKKEIDSIVKKYPHIHVFYTLTQNNDSVWDGYTGRISQELIKRNVPSFASCEYFVAGRGEMVDDMVSLLKTMGIENKKIKTDVFTGLGS